VRDGKERVLPVTIVLHKKLKSCWNNSYPNRIR
jgi:hypothetical protein